MGAPNKFSRDWLAQNYLDALHQAAREVLGGHPRITLIVDERAGWWHRRGSESALHV
jgi:chromosomal replication initiation ATPase DnaA